MCFCSLYIFLCSIQAFVRSRDFVMLFYVVMERHYPNSPVSWTSNSYKYIKPWSWVPYRYGNSIARIWIVLEGPCGSAIQSTPPKVVARVEKLGGMMWQPLIGMWVMHFFVIWKIILILWFLVLKDLKHEIGVVNHIWWCTLDIWYYINLMSLALIYK